MRFVSFEPLLGPVGRVDMDRIDWAIMGGASGSGYRRVGVTDLAPWREAWGAPVFFKVGRPGGERLLDGIRCDAYPAVAAPPPKPLKLLPGAPPGDSLLGDLL